MFSNILPVEYEASYAYECEGTPSGYRM